jgi:hypothetical protein
VSAEINGTQFSGAKGLAQMLREDKRVPQCLVRNVYAYGIGRPTAEKDEDFLLDETKAFAADGYRFKDLLANIATSPVFFKAARPAGLAPAKLPGKIQTNDARASIAPEMTK